jgi:transcriptional regulator with XRE-family HTH domain/PAS domain-containing protein
MPDHPPPILKDGTDGAGVLPLTSPLHRALAGPSWIAQRVEVAPGIVDAQIIQVTPAMVALLGYEEAPQLVGRYLSELHVLADVQTTRLYWIVRSLGFPDAAPWDYVARCLTAQGRVLRVVKHIKAQWHGPDGEYLAVQHEPWRPHHQRLYPTTLPPPRRLPTPEEAHAIAGEACVAELVLWAQYGMDVRDPLFRHQGMRRENERATDGAPPAWVSPQPRGLALHAIRQARRWSLQHTVEQLFQRTGLRMTRQYLSQVEHEVRHPSPTILRGLVALLQEPEAPPPAPRQDEAVAPPLSRPPRAAHAQQGCPHTQPWLDELRLVTQQLETARHARTQALVKAYKAGLSLREMAVATGLSPSGVRNLLHPRHRH